MLRTPIVKRLESGYWHVRWSAEIWAQWPCGRLPTAADFFHDTGTPERLRIAERVGERAGTSREGRNS